jgi:hypothetical protein
MDSHHHYQSDSDSNSEGEIEAIDNTRNHLLFYCFPLALVAIGLYRSHQIADGLAKRLLITCLIVGTTIVFKASYG